MNIRLAHFIVLWLGWSTILLGADLTPEELLKSKGLSKFGNFYLLQPDIKLPDAIKEVSVARRKMENNESKRNDIIREIKADEEAIGGMRRDLEFRDKQMERFKNRETAATYNKFVKDYNALVNNMNDRIKQMNKRRKDLGQVEDLTEPYVQSVMNLTARMEAMEAQYDTLSKDAEVTQAIAKANESTKAGTKLGPSESLKTQLKDMRKLRDRLQPAVIQFTPSGGVIPLEITVNENFIVPVIFDSGASYVTLSGAAADQIGLKESADDKTIELSIANGKTVKGRLTTLKSVRLGQFTVGNVECVVLPRNVPGSNLLGGSFLKNFIYRIDMAGGQIHLNQIAGKPVAVGEAHSEKAEATPSEKVETVDLEGTFRLVNASHESVLSITEATKNRGMPAMTGKLLVDKQSQLWELVNVRPGRVRIVSKFSQLCLGVHEGKKDPGADVITWNRRDVVDRNSPQDCDWTFERVDDETYRIRNLVTGTYLTGATKPSGKAVASPLDKNSQAQLWKLSKGLD